MRVAHITCLYPPEHSGGAPQQCRLLATGQAALGHDVAVFSGRLAPGARMYGVERQRLDRIPVTFITTTDAFSESVEQNWRNPSVEPAFREFLERHRPEVVHFHSIQSLGASLIPLARAHGARTVVTMHDLWWICARQFCVDRTWVPCIPAVTPGSCACQSGAEELLRRRRYLDSVIADVDLVLAPSDAVRERIQMSGVRARVEVDPNAVDLPPARPRASGGRGPMRVLFLGGSNRMKGITVLIPALRRLSELGSAYSADLYGIDPFAFGTTAATRGLPVTVHKSFPPSRLPEILGTADVLVLPSLMFESSSRVVREALLHGLAVVATETGGPEEVIEHGVNGLMVPPADPEALAQALHRLADDPKLRERLAAGGVRGEVPKPAEQVANVLRLYGTAFSAGDRRPSQSAPNARSLGGPVLFLAGIEGAPLRYRVHHAVEQLRLAGIESTIRHYADPRAWGDLDTASTLIVYRSPATRELLKLITEAHRRRLLVVFDVDDLIFDPDLAERLESIATLAPDVRRLWIEGVRRYRATLEACGRGMASTPAIAEAMRSLGLPAEVHPNGVSTPLMVVSESARRARRRDPDVFTLGYFSGTNTHDVDLEYVAEPLAGFLADYPDVRLVLGGHLRLPSRLTAFGDRIRPVPFAPWDRFPRSLAQLDLNLAPLIEGLFNDAKSSIKWSEAALVEVPTLASAREPFRASIREGVTGLLADSPEEWREQLEKAHADRDRLARVGRAARLAALRASSPWVLSEKLLATLTRLGSAAMPERVVEPDRWQSETSLTVLEPPDLLPGLHADITGRKAPGPDLTRTRLSIPLPKDATPTARVDVLVATYGRPAEGELQLRIGGGTAQTETYGDNAWASFEFDPPVASAAQAELSASGSMPVTVWTGAHGVVARSYHAVPVPPEFPAFDPAAAVSTPVPPPKLADRWRTTVTFANLLSRHALYLLQTEGPIRGGRRILRGVRRRATEWLITHR